MCATKLSKKHLKKIRNCPKNRPQKYGENVLRFIFSWCFIFFPRLPERFNFAHRNSFFMSHVISLWLVRTCNLQVLTSRREMSFELKGNANLIRYSDLCISLLITKKKSSCWSQGLNLEPLGCEAKTLPLS